MTATVLATSQLESVGEWAKIFPKQVTENYTSSVTFMKQLTVVAVSTMTYLKNVFPEDSYTIETFGGLKLRILKKKCRDELAQFVSTALMQAFEAFNKKYLHQLALCFYEDECKAENLVEYHIFEYTYHDDGVTMSVHSKGRNSSKHLKCTFEDVKERTIHMIRACVVIMQSCQQELPPCYDISLRLYYNEDAPEEYQAPGYLRAEESADHLAPSLPDAVKLGCVDTPFHRVLARSYIRDSLASSRDAIASQNPPEMTQNETPSLSGSSRRADPVVRSQSGIRCPCNKFYTDDDGDPEELITCVYCKTQQHASCFGIFKEQKAFLERHCCTDCSDADPSRTPTDSRLVAYSRKQRECLCIFRRTLWWCWEWGEVGAALLVARGVPPSGARRLLRLLRNHQLLPPGAEVESPDARLKLDREQLRAVMAKMFLGGGEGGALMEGILQGASQEAEDPVGEVLGPLKEISLQKTCQPSEPPPSTSSESALQEYRQAVLVSLAAESSQPSPRVKRKMERLPRTGVRTKRARTTK